MNYEQPHEVDDVTMALPGRLGDLIPPWDEIPDDFRRGKTTWNRWASRWFFNGLDSFPEANDGIDQEAVKRHLATIQRSFEPQHEHKEAAVAWLASKWLKEPETPQ